MMLSVEMPELCDEILKFPVGIHSFRLFGESTPRIVLKLPVSFLLPAKLNKGFKIYAVPLQVSGVATIGLMCAFFDDSDSPLVSWRLLDDSVQTLDIVHALIRQDVLVHLFDEHNREILGYRAQINIPLMAKIRLEHAGFIKINHESSHAAHEQAMKWFGLRNEEDDADAIQIDFIEPLFPEDRTIIDANTSLYQFHGEKGCRHTLLERVEPGPYQEIDIVLLLQNVFAPEHIYHGPKRYYDQEEIADIIVITESICLIVQAKDSPNTAQTLNRTLERKRLTSIRMLSDALKQAKGAVKYIDRTRPLQMQMDGASFAIDIENRMVLSLIVVRELFIDMYGEYSQALFGFLDDVKLPCIALDYAELQQYTTFCRDEASFISAYFQVFDKACELGSFPRLRFGVRDAEALLRGQE